jgi:hypothetical protein
LPSIDTLYIEFINVIDFMNQISIWNRQALAVNLYAIAARVGIALGEQGEEP